MISKTLCFLVILRKIRGGLSNVKPGFKVSSVRTNSIRESSFGSKASKITKDLTKRKKSNKRSLSNNLI